MRRRTCGFTPERPKAVSVPPPPRRLAATRWRRRGADGQGKRPAGKAPKHADFRMYVSKGDRRGAYFHNVKVRQRFITFRLSHIRKFLSFVASFPIFSIPRGRLRSWSKRCELRRGRQRTQWEPTPLQRRRTWRRGMVAPGGLPCRTRSLSRSGSRPD